MAKNYRAELVGVFGCPVEENPTGVVEEAGFKAAGLNYRYLTLRVEPDELPQAMAALRAFHMKGINLTIPHKVKVIPYLDELSPAAQVIGAVNTVVVREGRLYGENTDGKGFIQSLKDEGAACAGETAVLLGAGGAARAIGVECALNGLKKLYIVNRSEERGRELAALIGNKTPAECVFVPWRGEASIPQDARLVINATSIGLYPDVMAAPPIDYGSIRPGTTVCDVVFNPPDTLFLQQARARGAATITGLGMLANQAALNFTLWTGVEAPRQVMYDALKAEFEA